MEVKWADNKVITHSTTQRKTQHPPKTSGSTRARLDHHNPDETEENYLKNDFRKKSEDLKEEMKNSIKVEEKKNKKLEEIKKIY